MAFGEDLESRQLESYVDTGAEQSLQITLSGTPGTVTTITLPDAAKGVKMYPVSQKVQFAINNAAATLATSTATTIAASAFGVGGIAFNDMWETRLLPSGADRTLSLVGGFANTVVYVEVF
jgi:hypothetical protein